MAFKVPPLPAATKPALIGFVAGIIAMWILLPTYFGYAGPDNQRKIASAASASVLGEVCAGQFMADPDAAGNYAKMMALPEYNRSEFVGNGSWAKIPGVKEFGYEARSACFDRVKMWKPPAKAA